MAVEIALELQPCCGKRSGIGNYTYELARRMQDGDGLTFRGNLFNFCRRNDNRSALAGIKMPIAEQASMTYGVYRRIWGASSGSNTSPLAMTGMLTASFTARM